MSATRSTSPPKEPARHRLPDERLGITHKFTIYGQGWDGHPKEYEGYLTVGLYDDGSPGEIFLRFAKMGGRQGALLDAWCTMVSVALQVGFPLESIIDKFKGYGFEPEGVCSGCDEIKMCKSPLDYIARWLEVRFVRKEA
jgi:ribonucleoside-diphosphate reductase alpha chain